MEQTRVPESAGKKVLHVNDVIRYNEIPVLTTKQIAEAYGTTAKKVSNNFNANRKRFVEGKHYICLSGNELKVYKNESRISGLVNRTNKLYLWTDRGALLIAKSINTDTAWEAYERLVDFYFNQRKQEEAFDFTLEERPAARVTDTPAPLLKDWYSRNKWRMGKMGDQYHVTYAHICHKLLESVGRKYDLPEAKEIYFREQGEYPTYMTDLFTYFPEMGAMADKLLDKVPLRT